MNWRAAASAQYKRLITKLSARIDWVCASTFEIREDEHGRRVVTDHGDILKGEGTIYEVMALSEPDTPKRPCRDEKFSSTKH